MKQEHLPSQIDSPNVNISAEQIIEVRNSAMEHLRLRKHHGFRELGGLIIASFDTKSSTICVNSFLHDSGADATCTSIRLSFDVFDRAEEIVTSSNEDLYIAGTWHVHPSNIPPVPSSIDINTLFPERLYLSGEKVLARFPGVHLIFAQNMETYNAFLCKPNVDFDFIRSGLNLGFNHGHLELSDVSGDIYLLNETMVLSESKIKDADIIGFWRECEYPDMVISFESLITGGFYNRTGVEAFKYCRIFDSSMVVYDVKLKNRRIPGELSLDTENVKVNVLKGPDEDIVTESRDIQKPGDRVRSDTDYSGRVKIKRPWYSKWLFGRKE